MRVSAAPLKMMFPAGSVLFEIGPQRPALLVDDAFAHDDHHVLLQFVELADALFETRVIEGHLGNQDDVGLPVRRPQGNVPRVAAHDLDDGDAAMTFGRRADPLDARAAAT